MFRSILSVVSIMSCLSVCFSQPPNLWQPYRITPRTNAQHIDLSGQWELSYADAPITNIGEVVNTKHPFVTTVPNSVHWSLYKAGKLPHPYAHKNSTQYRWVEEKAWYYKKSFTIPEASGDKLILLCFDGIDYFSKVWVNKTLAGVHEGMFGGPVMDITSLVNHNAGNEVIVEVRAGNWGNKATDFESLPRTSTGDRDFSKRTGFNPRASGRVIKPWVISGGSGTEAFFSVGMWQGVRIEMVPRVHLERPFIVTKTVSETEALLHISTEVLAHTSSLDHQLHPWKNAQIHHPNEKGVTYTPVSKAYTLRVELLSGSSVAVKKEYKLHLFQGRNWVEEDIVVPDPKRWNPVGLGEPHLYKVRISLMEQKEITDQLELDYGIRTIERVPTAGPRTFDRWENWQFIVNGEKIFVKGMNWTPADVLLDLSEERYRWALTAAKEMGVQLIRVWGGGLLETDHFYDICNELGIMVWQDFPIGNQDTPDYPQDIWEAQVVQNIFRLRNHPSLVVWCGGNEFNPYSYGNAASVGIIERNLKIFDNTRLFVRTTPDDGSIHIYPDMDPTWYNRSYKYEAWVSETGMHSIPEPSLFYELVDRTEFVGLGKMWDVSFAEKHPEFIHHFTEYGPSRVPRMLSRASHISDMRDPTLESISEASQIGAGEWYQIVSEKMQGNYPVTAGLMPWVFKRHWPVIAIQMMDWFGQAAAPYYFLKRTYEPTHVAIDIPRLLWKKGERINLTTKITNASPRALENATVSVTVFNDQLREVWNEKKKIEVTAGTSVTVTSFNEYSIPEDYEDQFLFLVAELRNENNALISRSLYFPRVLSRMEDQEFYSKYTGEPIAWITLDQGPWLKPTIERSSTTVTGQLLSQSETPDGYTQLTVQVSNKGKYPSFMTKVDIVGTKRTFFASDNYFCLSPGEKKDIKMIVQWRESPHSRNTKVVVSAWNSKAKSITLP